MKTQQIVRDGAGYHYLVQDLEQIEHAWLGIPVKRVPSGLLMGTWMPKARRAQPRLIRKLGCTVVVATVEAGTVVEG